MKLALAIVLLCSCSKRDQGEPCDDDTDCKSGYVCFRGACSTTKTREATLNAQSGVGSAPGERPIVSGERVRVRVTNGEGVIFAACTATERLVGGGCHGGNNCASESGCSYLRSYPAGFSADDTLGARWMCNGAEGTMVAYALCQEATTAVVPMIAPVDASVPAD
ncbi:MAG: hypothetical protein H0V17_00390 [Deltaproteobacteria bacterium]|nr:hypothetical protein [Deltaproteobacteria bacterium]